MLPMPSVARWSQARPAASPSAASASSGRRWVDWVPAVGERLPATEIEIRGLVHLQQALARGKGAILWESNGFSRRVQAKRTLHTHGIRLHQTHGETHLGVMLSP